MCCENPSSVAQSPLRILSLRMRRSLVKLSGLGHLYDTANRTRVLYKELSPNIINHHQLLMTIQHSTPTNENSMRLKGVLARYENYGTLCFDNFKSFGKSSSIVIKPEKTLNRLETQKLFGMAAMPFHYRNVEFLPIYHNIEM